MELTLHYRGHLNSTNTSTRPKPKGAVHQHEIRKFFHKQLKILWSENPVLQGYKSTERFEVNREGIKFINLVTKKYNTYANLKIFLLRPEPRGRIIVSGDIDNRCKTIFDALTMPTLSQIQTLKEEGVAIEDKNPFYCLLEDDSLIYKYSVETAQLLEETSQKNYVELYITVEIKLAIVTVDNIGLGS